jgi:hypothetical protein
MLAYIISTHYVWSKIILLQEVLLYENYEPCEGLWCTPHFHSSVDHEWLFLNTALILSGWAFEGILKNCWSKMVGWISKSWIKYFESCGWWYPTDEVLWDEMRWEPDDELYTRMKQSWGVRFEILNVVSMKVVTAFWTLPPIIRNRTWHNWKMDLFPSSHKWWWEGTYSIVTTDKWINYISQLQLYKLLAPGFVKVR